MTTTERTSTGPVSIEPASTGPVSTGPVSTGPASASDAAIEAARADYAPWRARRLASVVSPTGNLSLVETRWLPAGSDVDAAAAEARAAAGDTVTVTVTTLERRNLDTGEPEHGIRVWDAASPAIAAFDTIEAFPFDPSWVIEAEFTPVEGDRTIPFEHIRDNGGSRELVVPGDIRFTRDGVDYVMGAFDDGGTLLLVFGDDTNRQTGETATYSSGRFLFVQRQDGRAFGDAGTVVLDFNQAFVPPCGFSVQYNCPLPPARNRFSGSVEAGERIVAFTGDFDIYAL